MAKCRPYPHVTEDNSAEVHTDKFTISNVLRVMWLSQLLANNVLKI